VVVLSVAKHLLLLHVEMGVLVEIQFAKAGAMGRRKNNVMIFMFSFLFLLEDCLRKGRNLCTKKTLSCDQFCILVVSFQQTSLVLTL
jgi:hypothetical protein